MKTDVRNCSAVTVTEDGKIKSNRNEFLDGDKLFAYMIEPVTPPKFFKWVIVICSLYALLRCFFSGSVFYIVDWHALVAKLVIILSEIFNSVRLFLSQDRNALGQLENWHINSSSSTVNGRNPSLQLKCYLQNAKARNLLMAEVCAAVVCCPLYCG